MIYYDGCPSSFTFCIIVQDNTIGYFNDKLWEVGVKLFADGSPHCGTAAVTEPYLNTPLTETLGFPPAPSNGTLNWVSGELAGSIRKWTNEGKQIAVHCHGERACEQVLEIYEQVGLKNFHHH